MQGLLKTFALGVFSLSLAATASATTFEYSEAFPSDQNVGNGNTGNSAMLSHIGATFDDVSGDFSFTASFDKKAGGDLPDFFTLVLNDGPMPSSEDNLGIFYFDATASDPTLSAYAYDASGSLQSYRNQPQFINSNSGTTDVSVEDNGDSRTIGFSLNAFELNGLDVLAGLDNFDSISFAEQIGLWFHWYSQADVHYGGNGEICSFSYDEGNIGLLDGGHRTTNEVPEPGTILLLGSALLGGRLKRKKAA